MRVKQQDRMFNVPEATQSQPQIISGDIRFIDYKDEGGYFHNRVIFDCYAFSFVQNGQKQIFRANGSTILREGYGMLIPEGNSIIAEHSYTELPYHSFIVFFPGYIGRGIVADKYDERLKEKADVPYICFETNNYLRGYIRYMRELIAAGEELSTELATMKIKELLLVLLEIAPKQLKRMFGLSTSNSLKNLIERNLNNPLTIEELAFLANRSLSSFKRDFFTAYGVSPQKYIRERRLELAWHELKKGKVASELYLGLGYQHLANFNTAFKRRYGITPSEHRKANELNATQ